MKKIYLFFLVSSLGLTACKKQSLSPAAVADFYFDSQHSSSITVRENTSIVPVNNSTNAVSYFWNFGNGKTSTEKTPVLSFQEGGDYTISLTATNKDGTSITTKKKVKVLSLAIYAVKIDDLNKWNGDAFSSLKKFNGGDVWVEIRKHENLKSYAQLPDGSKDYPLYYKTPVYKAISVNDGNSIEIPIPEKVLLPGAFLGLKYTYSFNLYVKDVNGTHMLFTSEFIGTSSLPSGTDTIEWFSLIGTKVTLKGIY